MISDTGQDNAHPCAHWNSGIHIGNGIPLEAVSRQSNCAMVSSDTEVVAGNHDYGFAKLTPSVAHHMNQSTNPGDSLYSGGENGNGRTFVALHDAVLDPSSGLKHAAYYFQLLQLLAQETCSKVSCAYKVLLECDGGADHNITFLTNQLALFGLFLASRMDKLDTTRASNIEVDG
eukprot:1718313-Ditylum_brightwellii.AAC.1